MKNKNFFIFLIALIVLAGCTGAKDALQGKKRSDGSDEFLIEKKNPLTKPPDYNELPVPISEENSYTENDESEDIEILLKKNKTNSNSSEQKNNNLEQSIIDKEQELVTEELKNSGKPDDIAKKISIGKMNKFKEENSLLTQAWVMEPKKKVHDVLKELSIADLKIKEFYRIKIGE